MAEIATIARPYAEALFGVAPPDDLKAIAGQLDALAAVAANPQLRQFADDPKAQGAQVRDVLTSVANVSLAPIVHNLLDALIDNNRLAALPEIATQFHALESGKTGISEALIESAFAIDAKQLVQVQAVLEKRFGRRLYPRVTVDRELIGGIRVVVGDEVLDTSVKARLEQMKAALV